MALLPSDASAMTEIVETTGDDTSSDYGDFTPDEQDIINQHLADASTGDPIVSEPLHLTDIEDYEEPRGLHVPKTLGREAWLPSWRRQQPSRSPPAPGTTLDQALLDNKEGNVDSTVQRKRAERESAERRKRTEGEASTSAEPVSDSPKQDRRSPMERFRTKPKKALSVTDLVSPAWCELQYLFTLSKHGKKRATPAMKQGTKVHKAREEAIHITVPVNTTTKEDSWGLRIWNIIQGLRSLRETGKTRELEVWGIVERQVVNGVIDELSYQDPVPGRKEPSVQRDGRAERSACQPSITGYLGSAPGGLNGKTFDQLGSRIEDVMQAPLGDHGSNHQSEELKAPDHHHSEESRAAAQPARTTYLTDIKTRAFKSLPSTLAFRPTEMQLQLYYWMIESLAHGRVPLEALTDRYDLDPDRPFSDSFIAQVGSLNEHFFDAASSQPQSQDSDTIPPPSTQSSLDVLLSHNSLSALWDLMIRHFRHTFFADTSTTSSPSPSPQPTTETSPSFLLSPHLTALYLHTPKTTITTDINTPSTPATIGTKSTLYSPSSLQTYLSDEMRWWRGDRDARGVMGGEAEIGVKCPRCEFRDGCWWVAGLERERGREGEVGVGVGSGCA